MTDTKVDKELSIWIAIRNNINDKYEFGDDWKKSIELYKSRIHNMFLEPIENIIKAKKLKGEGFAIVTVQCTLIESFAAFREGKIFNHKLKADSPTYEYKNSGSLFVDFLNSVEIFNNNFFTIDNDGKRIKNSPFDAEDFYKNVRCGLIHESKTKGKWKIKASRKAVKSEKIFINSNSGVLNLYRTILHYRLIEYLNSYCDDLTKVENVKLRKFFARKLDNLFEIEPDKNYDWWTGE